MKKITALIGVSLVFLQFPVNAGSWWDTGKGLLDDVVNTEPESTASSSSSTSGSSLGKRC